MRIREISTGVPVEPRLNPLSLRAKAPRRRAAGRVTLTEAYRIPKHKIPVEVVLAGRSPMLLSIYLGECAESHLGRQRPSELLDGPEPFFPATDAGDTVIFLHRDGLISVNFDARHEFGDRTGDDDGSDTGAGETSIQIEVMLEDGMSAVGQIHYAMPEGQRRLQDVLNLQDRFLILRVGERAQLINKRRIIRVSPFSENSEAIHGAHR